MDSPSAENEYNISSHAVFHKTPNTFLVLSPSHISGFVIVLLAYVGVSIQSTTSVVRSLFSIIADNSLEFVAHVESRIAHDLRNHAVQLRAPLRHHQPLPNNRQHRATSALHQQYADIFREILTSDI